MEDTRLFLEGRNDELIDELRRRMLAASDAERFEHAAQLRDAIRTIDTLRVRQQTVATVRLGDRDAVGVKVGPAGAVVQIFQMRNGRVVDRVELSGEAPGRAEGPADVLQAALQQFYELREPPAEVHVPERPEDADVLEAWLGARAAGRRVRLVVPRRGDRRALLDLAMRNAAIGYEARFNEDGAAHYGALETLQQVLRLPALPRRIEGFDISTIQGRDTVASLVVCEDGRLRPAEYRKFRIRAAELISGGRPAGPVADPDRVLDDVASMRQVVLRRYRRLLEQGGPFPDLVLIDGGRGQLSAAYAALREVGLENLVAIGLAKKEELIHTRDRADAIALPPQDPAQRLLQRIRDEAHRFAVTFHRRSRARRTLRSALDDVPGIGPRRRKRLLTAFGSAAAVRRATRQELVPLVGPAAADALLAHFGSHGSAAPGVTASIRRPRE